tara:strand:+ start:1604 stop:2083 length:480 start_codon:yes stop_codon:yes gene_type:complete
MHKRKHKGKHKRKHKRKRQKTPKEDVSFVTFECVGFKKSQQLLESESDPHYMCSCPCKKTTVIEKNVGVQRKRYNPSKVRGAVRQKNNVSLTMVNLVHPSTRTYIVTVECAAVAKRAMNFFIEKESQLGVEEAIIKLKVEPFVVEAKKMTKTRQNLRRK